MKRLAYILTAVLAIAACSREEINHPTEAAAPATATIYEPIVSVDQELNQVTFSIADKGVVPVWLFADSKGEYTVRQARNDYKRIFTAAGEYTVRMQVMNSAGITPDYVEKTFVIDNSLVDFDRYIRYFSGGEERTWRINNSVAAHQACGESIDNPTNWWSAAVDDKAGTSLYNSRITFDAEGNYTYASGFVYVNVGVTEAPYAEAGHDVDYDLPVDETTVPYTFSVEGDKVVLSLPAGTPFPYIPNNDYIGNPKFYVQSVTNKDMTLVWYTPTGNGGGPIAWQYILTSSPAEAPADSPIVGTWVMAADQPGHLACGETVDNSAGWWSAAAREKAPYGLYDNKLTFTNDGKYIFDPGEDGKIYVNIGVTKLDNGGATSDFDYAWEKQETTYQFDGETLTLPAGTMVGYIPNDDYFDNASFTVAELTETTLKLVWFTPTGNGGGPIAWQMIFVKEGGEPGPEDPGDDAAAFDYNADTNLWKPADAAHTYHQFYAPDWVEVPGVDVANEGAVYQLSYPTATSAQWQAQFHIIPDAAIALSAEKAYDFQVKLTTSENHNSITLKLVDTTNDGNFLFTELASTVADEEAVVTYSNLTGIDAAAVKMVFDFGGNAADTDVTIREIILREHVAGGTEPEPEEDFTTNDPTIDDSIFDIEGSGNLWRTCDVTFDHWYAAADWETELEPQIFKADDFAGLKVIVPKGVGGSEWQGQNKWHAPVAMSASKKYDIRFTISSDEDIYAFTVKLAKEGDDNAHSFYYDNKLSLKAHVPYTFKLQGVSPDVDYEGLFVDIDLGRAREGSAVTFTDFCLQESGGGSSSEPITYDSDANLWKPADAAHTYHQFYAPDWAEIPGVDVANEGAVYQLSYPTATSAQWQAQFHIIPDAAIALSAEKNYDFQVKLTTSENHNSITLKLVDTTNDGNFLFTENAVTEADEEKTVTFENLPGIDAAAVKMVFDFGGNAADTDVTIKEIILRVHP